MTDAHNHLQDSRFDGIRNQIIDQMIASGITRCVVNGTSPDDWPKVAELASQHPDLIIPSFGLHPWKPPTSDWLDQLKHYLDTTPNACVGECGLDRWIKNFDLNLQIDVFTAQLDLAATRNLPLSIHCLKAWGPLLDILESRPLPERGFLLHSYGGSAELVPRFVKLGAYYSFSGYFLHDRKQSVRTAFKAVPSNRLLFESDAPDMAPPEKHVSHPVFEKNGGKINHPANIQSVFDCASSFLDTSMVLRNFDQFFTLENNH